MARRYDLDWLRVLLFGLLVLHHTAVGFASFGAEIYGFANDQLGPPLLDLAVYWSHGWRLPALFVIAGIGTWFATGRRSGAAFLGRRLSRLLVPMLVGSFLLNLPVGWVLSRAGGEEFVFLNWPEGWWLPLPPALVMHLWFLGNLALYTVICWPLYAARARLEALAWGPLALVAALALGTAAVAVVAKPWAAAVAGDGYQLFWYAGFFAGGYVIGAQHIPVFDWARRRAFWLIGAGAVLFSVEVAMLVAAAERSEELAEALASGGWAASGVAPAYGGLGVGFAFVEGLDAWAWGLAALGLCARYLSGDGPVLRVLSPAVFPVYVFHFPVVLLGLGVLVGVAWPWWWEFLALAAAVYGLSWGAYVLARRLGPWVWLVGGAV